MLPDARKGGSNMEDRASDMAQGMGKKNTEKPTEKRGAKASTQNGEEDVKKKKKLELLGRSQG